MDCRNIWDDISKFNHETNFLIKFQDKLNWKLLSEYHRFTDEELGIFITIVDWETVSKYQKLTKEMLVLYATFVDWDMIAKYQTLSESTILRFKDRINWELLFERKDISNKFKTDNYENFRNFYKLKYVVDDIPSIAKYIFLP